MNEFSCEKGTRICKIVDSKLKGENGTEICVYDKDFRCCIHCSDKCKRSKPCCNECSKFTYHRLAQKSIQDIDIDKLMELLKKGDDSDDEETMLAKCKEAKGMCGSGFSQHHITLRSGYFQVVPTNDLNNPDTIYIAGKAGSGKSFWIARFLVQFKKYYPKFRIYLFSQKDHDKHLDSLITKRIPLNKLAEANFEVADFKETLMIWDDIDTIEDKAVNKATYALLEKILEVGRSSSIFTIMTSHLATDRDKTKRILNRCTAFVFFKKSSGKNTTYALENYINLTAREIRTLMRLDTHAYVIFRMAPQVILTHNELMFQALLDKEKYYEE